MIYFIYQPRPCLSRIEGVFILNIRDITYFIAVAECQHFGKAADRCCVSQPTLSMQLKKLERELNVQLFERSNKRVMITSIGQSVLLQARQVMQEIEIMKQIARDEHDPMVGEFRLGIIPTLGPYLLPQILKDLQRYFPKLELIIYENKTENIVEECQQGALDAIILALPVSDQGLTVEHLFTEKFLVALPAQHPLCAKKHINMDELQDEQLLLLEEGHCLREQALDACRFSGAHEKRGFKATSLETLRHVVAANGGITLLPEMSVRSSVASTQIAIRPFTKPEPFREIAMLWRQQYSRVTCCEQLAQQVRASVVGKVRE
jgi:LysR family transcriptional regulator, hydrogen peroxide-inducible genes activator